MFHAILQRDQRMAQSFFIVDLHTIQIIQSNKVPTQINQQNLISRERSKDRKRSH